MKTSQIDIVIRKPVVFFGLLMLSLPAFFIGCNKSSETAPAAGSTEALVSRGRTVYQTNCTACHNADPKRPGSIGPELFGSSKELIEARVMRAEYPAGYKPKRETKTMAALPHLKAEIDALHAYLNQ